MILLPLIGLCQEVAASETEPTVHYTEPVGTSCAIDGIEYKAYSLEDYKVIARIITDYHTLWKLNNNLKLQVASLNRDLETWELRSENWKLAMEDQKGRADTLSKMFDAQYAQTQRILKIQSATGWVPWALVVVMSIGFGVVGVYSSAR